MPDGTIEYAIYGAEGELPQLPDLRAIAAGAFVEISTSEVADDWQEQWKRFHEPILIEPPRGSSMKALYVRAGWLPQSSKDVEEIVIDPGEAFGTGAHATTKLCLRMLLSLRSESEPCGKVLDLGTGSGILAIAASKLGFVSVQAFDNERGSIAAARENASRNDVDIAVSAMNLRVEPLPDMTAAVVLANLMRPLLLHLSERLHTVPAHMLMSGLLTDEVDEVVSTFEARTPLRERERSHEGEWASVWLRARQ